MSSTGQSQRAASIAVASAGAAAALLRSTASMSSAPAFAVGAARATTNAPPSPKPVVAAVAVAEEQSSISCEVVAGAAGAAMVALSASRSRRSRAHRTAAKPVAVRSTVARAAAPISVTSATDRGSISPPGVYCEEVAQCVRRKTRTITIGDVKVGSEHPVATQTMATTLTGSVEDTVEQVKKCADMGIDIVRITVQGMREAKACEFIKKRLLEDGYTTPLVADIHFTPKVALKVADFVDKIRVNPGNFADGRKTFDTLDELTDADIAEARAEIEESFVPLVLKLKEKNKALRIGVNHGSMAERILFQYGDSPEGMVASAVEFGEICRAHDYHNFLFSMKSSNPKVMVDAYRQLAKKMYELGWDYPLHLGVTEAGGGSDGRIKSAVGIGALLIDGLGDTIRVSLTEDPEYEAAPCKALREVSKKSEGKGVEAFEETGIRRQGKASRRVCEFPMDVPLNVDGSVITKMTSKEIESMNKAQICQKLGLRLRADGDIQKDWKSIDVVLVDGELTEAAAKTVKMILDVPVGVICVAGPNVPDGATLLLSVAEATKSPREERLGGHVLLCNGTESAADLEKAATNATPRFMFLKPKNLDGVTFLGRSFFQKVTNCEATSKVPCMLWYEYPYVEGQDDDAVVMTASADFGSLFIDGLGEGILWDSAAIEDSRESCFNLLQASRMRISKTEFISCPSCGRTLFNLQDTTAMIQKRTGHLPGVRIAVMGCIVNGPGEMADADFGYVGSGVGKIDLYVNYDCVKRGIPSENAVDKLVDLIKEHGRWIDPADPDDEINLDDVGEISLDDVGKVKDSAVAALLLG